MSLQEVQAAVQAACHWEMTHTCAVSEKICAREMLSETSSKPPHKNCSADPANSGVQLCPLCALQLTILSHLKSSPWFATGH